MNRITTYAGLVGFLLTSACATRYDVKLVDRNATAETKALYSNLKDLSGSRILFGHQDDLAYGVHWKDEPGRSDVKDVVGSYPAVFGWDVGNIEGSSGANLDDVSFENMKAWIKEGFKAGGVITISWHMNNPVSGGNSWDTTRAVYAILPGGEQHEKYKAWLDRFAAFNADLEVGWLRQLGLGTKIPIVFRPFHEHTGSWFWWGGKNVTADEFITLWRFTVEYLRDEKGIRNLMFAYSPDRFNSIEEYLAYYPGDDYVDILGIDDYSLGGTGWAKGLPNHTPMRLSTVIELAEQRGKIAAYTETGSDVLPNPKWWTEKLLPALTSDSLGRKVAWVLVWRNANTGHHHAPFDGHPSAPDFVKFYEDPAIVFADSLPNLYR